MENWQKRALDLVWGLSQTNDTSPSVIPYTPQKTRINGYEHRYFKRSSPEAHGISSQRLISMLYELESDPAVNVHNLMVIKDTAVIAEASQPGYDVNMWHLSHSMSKTVTGMAIGLLVDDGLLDVDRTLVSIFPEKKYKDKRFKNITVEHLLSMTSGVAFAEAGSVTETRWLDAFFASAMFYEPGLGFSYNSMNSYALACVCERITGKHFGTLVKERIFKPLGITNYFWEKGPEGVEKGGWGLYLSPESWGKLGVMMLQGGSFDGKRILSDSWVRRAVATHGRSPERSGDFNYGYQLWVNRYNDEFLFNGMLGQNVWVCPLNNIVVVINSGNNEMFQNSPAIRIVRKYLSVSHDDSVKISYYKSLKRIERDFYKSRSWAKPMVPKLSLRALLGLETRHPFDEGFNDLLGKEYHFRSNHVGLLPLFVRCMQNNLLAGVEKIRFDRMGDMLIITATEGNEIYRIEAGFYNFEYAVCNFRGEKYIVGAMAESMLNKDGSYYYKLEFVFPELPNTRRIEITRFSGDKILMRFSEVPDNKIVESLFEAFPVTNPKLTFAIGVLEARFGDGFLASKLEGAFTPKLVGIDEASPSYERDMEEEEIRAGEMSKFAKTASALIDKIVSEIDDEDMIGIKDFRKSSLFYEFLNKINKIKNK